MFVRLTLPLLCRTGDPQKAHKFLAVLDGREAFPGESYHNVALSYGTLPRAPRRAASGSSLPRDGAQHLQQPPRGPAHYATLGHPHPHHSAPPFGRSAPYGPPLPPGAREQPHPRYRALPSSPHPPPPDGPAQPVRLDVPPDGDWRGGDYRKAQPHPQSAPRPAPYARATLGHALLGHAPPCSLCQQLPAEPSRYYCYSCGVYMARFRPTSR